MPLKLDIYNEMRRHERRKEQHDLQLLWVGPLLGCPVVGVPFDRHDDRDRRFGRKG